MARNQTSRRLSVLKTYKIFIGGQFPRTESGRYYQVKNASGEPLANACLSSRKDVRDAVSAARGALGGWSGKTAYNRGQILYRMAEILETRRAEMQSELLQTGSTKKKADKEIDASIDLLVYYAGWCDKYQQLFSTVNPVASSHFNFSVPEPMGVVGIIPSDEGALFGLISNLAPVIAGGNTCLMLADYEKPLAAICFAEILATSDLPAGVVNILTGKTEEMLPWLSGHMDVNALVIGSGKIVEIKKTQQLASENLKRVIEPTKKDVLSPYRIIEVQEIKTTWHPIENIAASGIAY